MTTFADVGAIALICADVDAARSWVWGTLADLAVDDESHARLRNTLQVFLRAGTYTATAERLVLHKNSVQYRIRKAEEALGGRIDDRRKYTFDRIAPAHGSIDVVTDRSGRTQHAKRELRTWRSQAGQDFSCGAVTR